MPASLIDAVPAGCLIAGGAGSRMGGAKPAALLGGKPLYQYALERMRPQVGQLSVNSGPAGWIPQDTPCLPDRLPDQGPLMGLEAGLLWAKLQGFRWLFTAPIDSPFLPKDVAQRLSHGRTKGTLAVVAQAGGRIHNLTALWHVDVLPIIMAHLDQHQRSVHKLIAAVPHEHVEFGEPRAFFNINTSADLKEAVLLLNTPGLL